ncbi:AMP-binding protein [Pseudanabaena sp. FACHB-1998]|uniref:class I adenylate-forming enzyme family protein n=1 Tax=Pseudanabaena sp. FACHB-1998 TaxID=2692858 RepID=UPI00168182C3|nr:AMP-binding protein [Pseudanabaena sp. FACHB-1998]MBD2179185.1 AMP-binding protein [Pseudanabaena sp. FACHB-1998]
MNLAQFILETATQYENKPAIIFERFTEQKVWTYREFSLQVQSYAAKLDRMGIKKGDRVAVQLPKCVEFLFWHFAILSIGAIALPLNPDYRPEEIDYFLTDSGSSLYITTKAILAKFPNTLPNTVQNTIAHLSELKILIQEETILDLAPDFPLTYPASGDDIAMICYTSGTTGRSKGAAISHRNLIANTKALHQAWGWSDRDVLLHVLPLFHVHGLNVATLGGLHAGATMVMFEKFEPQKAWEAIATKGCTIFMGVPTIYQRLINTWSSLGSNLEHKPDLSKMRLFISGSAPLSDQQFHRFEQMTGFRILERYGMTETGMNASNLIDPEHRKAKSVGFPLSGVEIRIVNYQGDRDGVDVKRSEVGEVWIRGENVFQGYWQMPDKTAEAFVDGWFRTGDLGYQDANDNGRLYLVGRAKELIITGGFNVYPKEIENVLECHEAVKESAVIGLPDEDFGEKVIAAIALKDGDNVNAEAIIAHCKERLVSYKCPKQIFFVKELPRNAMGKIQKNILTQELRQQQI